jgi:hypothetical protein
LSKRKNRGVAVEMEQRLPVRSVRNRWAAKNQHPARFARQRSERISTPGGRLSTRNKISRGAVETERESELALGARTTEKQIENRRRGLSRRGKIFARRECCPKKRQRRRGLRGKQFPAQRACGRRLSEKRKQAVAICFSREKSNPNAQKTKRRTKPQRAAAAGVKQRKPKIRTGAAQTLGARKSSEAKASLAPLQPWAGPPARTRNQLEILQEQRFGPKSKP